LAEKRVLITMTCRESSPRIAQPRRCRPSLPVIDAGRQTFYSSRSMEPVAFTRCFRLASSTSQGAFSPSLRFETDPVCPCTSRQPGKRHPQRRSVRNILPLGNKSLTRDWASILSSHTSCCGPLPTIACKPPNLSPDFTPLPPNCHRINIRSTPPFSSILPAASYTPTRTTADGGV